MQSFHHFDWDAFEKAMSLLTPMNAIYVSKHVIGFPPIGKNMTRRGSWKEPFCPRCSTPVETTEHILQRPHYSSQKIVKSSHQKFATWLNSVQTEPNLAQHILETISAWNTDSVL